MHTRRKGRIDIDTSVYQSARRLPIRVSTPPVEEQAQLLVGDSTQQIAQEDFPSSSSLLSDCDTEIYSPLLPENTVLDNQNPVHAIVQVSPETFRCEQQFVNSTFRLDVDREFESASVT